MLAAFLGCALSLAGRLEAQPANDLFKNAQPVAGNFGTVTVGNAGATKEAGEPSHALNIGGASIWFRWTAPAGGTVSFSTAGSTFDTVMAAYRGDAIARLSLVVSNDDDPSGGQTSKVTFTAVAGESYSIAVDGYATSGTAAKTGMVTFRWDLATLPANDAFQSAQILAGADGNWTGNNRLATLETGEPRHSAGSGGHSLWFRWVAPASGEVSFSTVGSDFDTVIAGYTGARLDGLVVVARNDDVAGSGGPSRLVFAAVSGVTYSIAVDGYSNDAGSVVLRWECVSCLPLPTNDAFAGAQELSGDSGAIEGSTVRASKEPSEPPHAGNRGGRSLWYRWKARGTGVARFDTEGSVFDTLLAVYQGSQLGSLLLVASNDDQGVDGPRTSQIRFAAGEGQTYFIALDGRADYEATVGEGGRFNLHWVCEDCASQSTDDLYLDATLGRLFRWASDTKRFYQVQGLDVFGQWEDLQTGIPGTGSEAEATVRPRKSYTDYRILAMTGEYLRPIGPVTNLYLESSIQSRGVGDKFVLANLHGAGIQLSAADYVEATYAFNQTTRTLEPTVSEVIPDLGVTVSGQLLAIDPSPKVIVDANGVDYPPGTEHALSVPSGRLRARLSAGQVLGIAVIRPTEDLFLEVRDSRQEIVLNRFVAKQSTGGREVALPVLRTGEYSMELLAVGTNVSRASLLFRNLNSNGLGKLVAGQQLSGAFSETFLPPYFKYSARLKAGQRLTLAGTVGANIAVLAVDDRSTVLTGTAGGGISFTANRDGDYFVFVFRIVDATTGQFDLRVTLQ